jgi:hypothetical protein
VTTYLPTKALLVIVGLLITDPSAYDLAQVFA